MGWLQHIVIFLLALCACTIGAAEEESIDAVLAVQKEADRGGYGLMGIDGLWEKYQDSQADLLLIDTRQEWEYSTGSIEGAVHFPMESTWFSRLIQRGSLAQVLGPDKERILVFY